jgi:dipeptidyl aminopeptidase/acylaminoacyl peptidase
MKKRFIFTLLAGLTVFSATAQEELDYQKAPQAILDLLEAKPTPIMRMDSKGQRMLLLERAALPSIAELAEPELRLAGYRINPSNYAQTRSNTFTGIKIQNVANQEVVAIKNLPTNLAISAVQWSPDETKIAFINVTPTQLEIWVIDLTTQTASKISNLGQNATFSNTFDWFPDSKSLLIRTVPTGRGEKPTANPVPTGATIQENIARKAPSRTFQDLLKNKYDENLFDYYFTSQVVKLGLDGSVQPISKAGVVLNATVSPDGNYVLMRTIHRPYSYLVPASRFPMNIEIYDTKGNLVKQLIDLPLQDNIPVGFDAVQKEPRNYAWREDASATVYWVEAQDGGNPKTEAAIRDKVFALAAPFNGTATEIASTALRFAGIQWGNAQTAICNEFWWANRKIVTKLINPEKPTTPAVVLFDRSTEDRYNDPGQPQMKRNEFGRYVLDIQKDNNVFMVGEGASEEGNRPFIDKFNLTTKKSQRLFRSEAPYYEQIISVLDAEKQLLVTSRESKTENPNFFIRDLKKKKDNVKQITFFPHPYSQLKDVQKQKLRYKRADGLDLTATLYLPADYKKENGALPTFVWAYPEEFKSKAAAAQVQGSPYEFTYLSWGSPIFFVTQGYAVLDDASMPIVGEGDKEPNDSFVEQLVANAKAVIDEGVRLGVVDAKRVGVGGHSYGAFMTANLLTNCDLFRAGIARSGAYNRTLTPFGFQQEERTYWQAPKVYNEMSPFMNAEKMNEPLLLVHGELDNNAGTFPLQSERYFNALKGLGATVRYVLLPLESHGYRAKESVNHMFWEMTEWLDKYVKKAK